MAASGMTDTHALQVLRHLFRSTSYTKPATYYIALTTTVPSASAAGTEVTGNNYSRASVSSGNAYWTEGSRQVSNTSTVTFATPSGSWGTIAGCNVYDDPTAGNRLWFQEFTSTKVVNSGDPPTYAAGTLVFQMPATA